MTNNEKHTPQSSDGGRQMRVYFISDAHLGSRAVPHSRQQERRLVRFLDEIKGRASALYMLGDMFDFWYEYHGVVPQGHTRFLGKLSELTDAGVEVHYFTGNHDHWCYTYLQRECGVILHRGPETIELGDQLFYMSHGDGLGDPDPVFRFLRHFFHNSLCQFIFSCLHPSIGVEIGLRWAKHSREKHDRKGEPPYMGEDKEFLVRFAKEYLAAHPEVNYFMFGHRHIELDLMIARHTRILILGDWVSQFTYAVYDGEQMYLESYVEGDTEP